MNLKKMPLGMWIFFIFVALGWILGITSDGIWALLIAFPSLVFDVCVIHGIWNKKKLTTKLYLIGKPTVFVVVDLMAVFFTNQVFSLNALIQSATPMLLAFIFWSIYFYWKKDYFTED